MNSNLAQLLKNRGKTLSDLARAMEVDKGTVSRWNQKGVPSERLADVAAKSGIPACDLRPDLAEVLLDSARRQ